jgi:hypothetical protein
MSWSPASSAPRPAEAKSQADLAKLFHRLNNQLGVILANAELLESKLTDETQRSRASQISAGTIEAISAVQEIRSIVEPPSDR